MMFKCYNSISLQANQAGRLHWLQRVHLGLGILWRTILSAVLWILFGVCVVEIGWSSLSIIGPVAVITILMVLTLVRQGKDLLNGQVLVQEGHAFRYVHWTGKGGIPDYFIQVGDTSYEVPDHLFFVFRPGHCRVFTTASQTIINYALLSPAESQDPFTNGAVLGWLFQKAAAYLCVWIFMGWVMFNSAEQYLAKF